MFSCLEKQKQSFMSYFDINDCKFMILLRLRCVGYSHSIVAGGLEEMS